MVGWLGRRTEPRVGFRREVRVIWPGQVSSVVARAVNLSSTGILVDAATPEPCPVGSPVVCDVALPRGPLRLRGRVAHHRMLSPAKVGMGIAFTDLSPHMVAELRDVVDGSDEKAQLVRLRFAGKNQLVCTRALPTAEGFQFTTALPFLRSDTEVEISLSPDANLTTKGWVSSVALGPAQEDGIPRLVIDIRAGESAAPRLAPDAAVSGEVESPVASPEVGAVPTGARPRTDAARSRRCERRRRHAGSPRSRQDGDRSVQRPRAPEACARRACPDDGAHGLCGRRGGGRPWWRFELRPPRAAAPLHRGAGDRHGAASIAGCARRGGGAGDATDRGPIRGSCTGRFPDRQTDARRDRGAHRRADRRRSNRRRKTSRQPTRRNSPWGWSARSRGRTSTRFTRPTASRSTSPTPGPP